MRYDQKLYKNTSNPNDIVTLPIIFLRYLQINETYKGFEEYVDDGFMNGIEVEYVAVDEK